MKLFLLAAALLPTAASALADGPWSDTALSPSSRAKKLLAAMTQAEKLSMLHGPATGPCCSCNTSASCAYVGNINPIARLGIPPINMNDGPQGFRDNVHPGTTTAWPSGLSMAASWDVAAMGEWGTGMGKEFYAKGANVQLGPGLCLARVPRNGRNFEYLSGEDPFLGYTLVQPVIKGIQSQKVVANAKHYINNNQETNRGAVSEEVDERTRFEMYYPAFAGAVEAGVGSIMCSYNKINGIWSCENSLTLAGDLKNVTGFQGYVMSDWGATHSTSIMEGLDVEMPGAGFMNADMISAGIAAKNISQDKVDDSVYRILWAMFSVGVMDEPASAWDWKKQATNSTTEASVNSARHLAAVSQVLLKNENNALPLPKTGGKRSIAVIGFGGDNAVVHGGGSGSVVPSYVVPPKDAIAAKVGKNTQVSFDDGADLTKATALASSADVAIVFVGTLSHEGGDRASLSLDDGCDGCKGNTNNQNAMVAAVAGGERQYDRCPLRAGGDSYAVVHAPQRNGHRHGLPRWPASRQRGRRRPVRRRQPVRPPSADHAQQGKREGDVRRAVARSARSIQPAFRYVLGAASRGLSLLRGQANSIHDGVPVWARFKLHDVRVLKHPGRRGAEDRVV